MQYVTACKHEVYPSFMWTLFYVFQVFLLYSYYSLLMENLFDLLFMLKFNVSGR